MEVLREMRTRVIFMELLLVKDVNSLFLAFYGMEFGLMIWDV